MTTAVLNEFELLEDFYTPILDDTIDEDNAVIRGVKILGKVSENGFIYSDEAMKYGVPLYEGATVNIDHPNRKNPEKERGFMEGIGFLKNVKWKPDGIYGDFHYYKSHPYTPTLLERARRNPKGFGLSHNADGGGVRTKNGTVIEKIRKVRSVDVVGKPATTKSLFESQDPEIEDKTMKKFTLKQLVESHGSADEKKHLSLLEDAAIIDCEVELEEGSESVKSGFGAALVQLHESGNREGVSKLLAAEKFLQEGPPAPESPADGPTLESVQEELRQLKAKNERMELEKEVMILCESESFKPEAIQMKHLCLCESRVERVQLIDSWKQAGRPQRSGRREQLEDVGSYEEERKKLTAQN